MGPGPFAPQREVCGAAEMVPGGHVPHPMRVEKRSPTACHVDSRLQGSQSRAS